MLPLLLTSLALAADPASLVPTAEPVAVQKKGGRKNHGEQQQASGKTEWKNRFYARPIVSGSVYTSASGKTSSAVGLGGEGGIRYWQVKKPFPRLRGRTRATVQYIGAIDSNGMELKVGSFMGPAWEYIALESGLDISWDRYEWDGVPMKATVGYGVPIIATTGISIVTIYAGFQPTFLSNPDRRVNWAETEEFGFGHQFTTFAGVALAIDDMSVGLGYSRTVTQAGGHPGVQQGYGLTLGFRG
jgi:hypothetical protein